MPATIQTAPPAIAASKNSLWLRILSDDFQAAAVPAASVNKLEFPGAVAADDVISLTWVGGAATMTAKAVPDESGLQFPAGDGSWAYVQSLVDYFAGNAFIFRDFEVLADNGGAHPALIFPARAKSPDFDFTPGANISTTTPGVTDATKPNFRHQVQLWLANVAGTVYIRVFNQNIPLDAPGAGLTSSDIHEALHAFLEADRPETASAKSQCINSIRPYYFVYGQVYGTEPTVRLLKKSTGYVISKGGLGIQAAADHSLLQELAVNPADKTTWRFLRQGSKNKLVTKQQPEWLSWINLGDTDLTGVQLEVTVYNDDATNITLYSSADFIAPAYSKWQFQAGYAQLGIAGSQSLSKKPIYYTCRLKGDDGYLSAAYGFVIDYRFIEWPRYFVYENSLGAFQTICTTGKGQSEFDKNAQLAELAVDLAATAVSGSILETNITWQDKTTVNYGYRRASQRTLDLLRDFFSSQNIYQFVNGKLIPVTVSTKNIKDAPDGTNVYSSAFEYSPKYAEEVYTEQPGLQDDSINELLTASGTSLENRFPYILPFSL